MFTQRSLHHGDVNHVIYDAEGACEGWYRCTPGLIWGHARAIMGSREGGVIGLASRAVSALVTKHFIIIFSILRM